MGIVSRQASIASFLSYIGVIIGFVNVTVLMTQWFTEEQFGLREALLGVAVFTSHVAHLGTYRSLVRFFPFFSKDGKNDNGLLLIGLSVPFLGFLISMALIYIFNEPIIDYYSTKSPLFVEYFWFVVPLIFLLMYNNVMESYFQAKSNTVFPIFLKTIFNRLTTTILLVLYYVELISFYQFIVFFTLSYGLNILLFILYLIKNKELNLTFNPIFFKKRVRKVYFNYSAFSILSNVSNILVNRIDVIMITGELGLASTAIYANSLYLCALILIPSESISKISLPLLSKLWREKSIHKIEEIYKKTSITQFTLSSAVFVVMWGSVDNFYAFQGGDYFLGKWVFFTLGLGKIINMLFGANGQIISVSKYYRFDTTTGILLGILTVVTNIIFIPLWGILGASIATALSVLLFNLTRFLFIYIKMGIQPFSINTLKSILIILIAFLLNEFIPQIDNLFVDTFIRSSIIAIVYGVLVYILAPSRDLNDFIQHAVKRLKI